MIEYLLFLSDDEEEREKIQRLYCEHVEGMLVFARSNLYKSGDKNYYHDALDAVQNAFAKIIKYKTLDFSRNPQEIKSYLCSAVINEVTNILNDITKEKILDEKLGYDVMSDEDFFERLCVKERCLLVRQAIDLLDERYSSTLLLNINHTPAEIADMLDLPIKTVYTRILRGRKLLIEKVEFLERIGVTHG